MDATKTKAALRAMREDCGLTQQDVADEFGVRVLTVKRWERPGESEPPDDVWSTMLSWHDELRAEAKRHAEEIISMRGEEKNDAPVVLAYYRTQDELDARQLPCGLDRPVGYANAITREVARLLAEEGVAVRYAYWAE